MKELPSEVLVLGMHRSGTSMLSGVLDRLGVDMGEDKPGRQVSNPMGHYEDGDFLSLNESILEKAGGSWDNPPSAENIQSQAASFTEEVQVVILSKEQAKQNQIWGWKDPRTSLTIQLYLPYLKNPSIIWCQRDPAAIAGSLLKRNNIPYQESERLTEYYQQQINNFLRGHSEIPVLIVSYQDIIDKPDFWIQKLIDFLDIEPEENQLSEAREFILPRKKIQREKKILWLKNLLSLPVRFLRRMKIITEK